MWPQQDMEDNIPILQETRQHTIHMAWTLLARAVTPEKKEYLDMGFKISLPVDTAI